MTFNRNVPPETQQEIRNLWGNTAGQLHYEKYLDLPSLIGKLRTKTFLDIKNKVMHMLQGWKEWLLSQGGKEILIKAMALAILTHSMSCFLLPKLLLTELESLMAKFWWRQ